MALNDGEGTGMVMPVGPMYGGGNGGFGNFGGDWGWIILLLLLAGGNGWGNGFGGWGGGMGGFAADGAALYPWMNQAELTNNGFRDAAISDGITSIRDGVQGLATQICNGFSSAEIAANGRQMAHMNQLFGLQSQFADCCCENRLGIADLKYTVATENCADRQALSDGVRDIIASNTASTQAILDKLCQQEIEAKNDTIATLRQELLYARGQASQDVQTAALRAGQVAEVDALYSRLKDCPVPAMPVYGQTPIFTCNNSGCGCGM